MTITHAAEIGFGSSNLYGGSRRALSVALVRAAADSGIKWIDTAPLYGHGAAEEIVGEAIRGRRDELVLVSKVGILPTQIKLPYRLRSKATAWASRVPGGNALFPPPAPLHPKFNVFAPTDVVVSVERSLRALGTDRLDYLLLHEVDPQVASDPVLLDVLDALVTGGKVLAYGTATQADKTRAIAAGPQAGRFALFQMPADTDPLPTGSIVLHSLLGGVLRQTMARLKTEQSLRETAKALDIDPDQPDLARRLIASALRREGVRAVLFSTSDVDRVRDMVGAATLSPAAADAGKRLIAKAMWDG